jgi:hypothetical protein
MAATRAGGMALGLGETPAILALVCTAAGVIVPLVLFRLLREGRLSFLYVRPTWARIERTLRTEFRGEPV